MIKFIFRAGLYLDESLSVTDSMDMKDKLRKKPPFNCPGYMITASENPNDMVDIVSISMLNLYKGPKKRIIVYGLAANREGAIRLVERMVLECRDSRGDYNLREFLA